MTLEPASSSVNKALFDLQTLKNAIEYHREEGDGIVRGFGANTPDLREASGPLAFLSRQPQASPLAQVVDGYMRQSVLIGKIQSPDENTDKQLLMKNAFSLAEVGGELIKLTEFDDLNEYIINELLPKIVDYLDWLDNEITQTLDNENPFPTERRRRNRPEKLDQLVLAKNALFQLLSKIATEPSLLGDYQSLQLSAGVLAKKEVLNQKKVGVLPVRRTRTEYKVDDCQIFSQCEQWFSEHHSDLTGENRYTSEQQQAHQAAKELRGESLQYFFLTNGHWNGNVLFPRDSHQVLSSQMLSTKAVEDVVSRKVSTSTGAYSIIARQFLENLIHQAEPEEVVPRLQPYLFAQNDETPLSRQAAYRLGLVLDLMVLHADNQSLVHALCDRKLPGNGLWPATMKELNWKGAKFWRDNAPQLKASPLRPVQKKAVKLLFNSPRKEKLNRLELMINDKRSPLTDHGAVVLIKKNADLLYQLTDESLEQLVPKVKDNPRASSILTQAMLDKISEKDKSTEAASLESLVQLNQVKLRVSSGSLVAPVGFKRQFFNELDLCLQNCSMDAVKNHGFPLLEDNYQWLSTNVDTYYSPSFAKSCEKRVVQRLAYSTQDLDQALTRLQDFAELGYDRFPGAADQENEAYNFENFKPIRVRAAKAFVRLALSAGATDKLYDALDQLNADGQLTDWDNQVDSNRQRIREQVYQIALDSLKTAKDFDPWIRSLSVDRTDRIHRVLPDRTKRTLAIKQRQIARRERLNQLPNQMLTGIQTGIQTAGQSTGRFIVGTPKAVFNAGVGTGTAMINATTGTAKVLGDSVIWVGTSTPKAARAVIQGGVDFGRGTFNVGKKTAQGLATVGRATPKVLAGAALGAMAVVFFVPSLAVAGGKVLLDKFQENQQRKAEIRQSILEARRLGKTEADAIAREFLTQADRLILRKALVSLEERLEKAEFDPELTKALYQIALFCEEQEIGAEVQTLLIEYLNRHWAQQDVSPGSSLFETVANMALGDDSSGDDFLHEVALSDPSQIESIAEFYRRNAQRPINDLKQLSAAALLQLRQYVQASPERAPLLASHDFDQILIKKLHDQNSQGLLLWPKELKSLMDSLPVVDPLAEQLALNYIKRSNKRLAKIEQFLPLLNSTDTQGFSPNFYNLCQAQGGASVVTGSNDTLLTISLNKFIKEAIDHTGVKQILRPHDRSILEKLKGIREPAQALLGRLHGLSKSVELVMADQHMPKSLKICLAGFVAELYKDFIDARIPKGVQGIDDFKQSMLRIVEQARQLCMSDANLASPNRRGEEVQRAIQSCAGTYASTLTQSRLIDALIIENTVLALDPAKDKLFDRLEGTIKTVIAESQLKRNRRNPLSIEDLKKVATDSRHFSSALNDLAGKKVVTLLSDDLQDNEDQLLSIASEQSHYSPTAGARALEVLTEKLAPAHAVSLLKDILSAINSRAKLTTQSQQGAFYTVALDTLKQSRLLPSVKVLVKNITESSSSKGLNIQSLVSNNQVNTSLKVLNQSYEVICGVEAENNKEKSVWVEASVFAELKQGIKDIVEQYFEHHKDDIRNLANGDGQNLHSDLVAVATAVMSKT